MDDLISRQAVIELVQKYHGKMPNEINHQMWKEANDLPSAQPEQRWIPCSERLPERYYNYLITTGKGDIDIGTFSPELNRWYICDADGFKRAEYVIAWMPLPTPYRERVEQWMT